MVHLVGFYYKNKHTQVYCIIKAYCAYKSTQLQEAMSGTEAAYQQPTHPVTW